MEIVIIICMIILSLWASCLDGFGILLFLATTIGGSWLLCGTLLPITMWITQSPVTFISGLVLYLTTGVAWSFFKWYRFVLTKTEYTDRIKRRAKEIGISPLDYYLGRLPENITELQKDSWRLDVDCRPSVVNHIDKLSTWWICWPASVVVYVVGDFLYDITKQIINWFSTLYTQITEYAIKRMLK